MDYHILTKQSQCVIRGEMGGFTIIWLEQKKQINFGKNHIKSDQVLFKSLVSHC